MGARTPENRADAAHPGLQPVFGPEGTPRISEPGRPFTRLIPDLRPDERVVLLQRKHPAVLLRRLSLPVVLLVLWLVGTPFALTLMASLRDDAFGPFYDGAWAWVPSALWLAWLAIAILMVCWASYRALDWMGDWIALTTRRIIIMEKSPLLREARREVPVGRVHNVSAEYPNSMGVAFDYGDIQIDTAGIGMLVFEDLPRPKVMREAIFDCQDALMAGQPTAEDRRKLIVEAIVLGEDPLAHEAPTPPNGNAPPLIHTPAEPAAPAPPSLRSSLFPFEPQRADGSVTWHKHWIFLVRGLFVPFIVWVVGVGAWLAVIASEGQGQVGTFAVVVGWLAVALTFGCFLWALWNWDDWRNDLYRVDHERLYDIERLPFGLREQSKETRITRITDVTYVIPGPFAHLLNYGDVVLKTPGESTEFTFSGVPRPRDVQQEIMDRMEQYQRKRDASNDREITAWLRAYHEAHGADGGE